MLCPTHRHFKETHPTMEGPAAADGADDEYMAMDAEQWSDHEDIYENGDTVDRDPGGQEARGDRQETAVANRPLQNTENPRATQPSGLPLPDRYITIRRPPLNGSGRKRLSQLGKHIDMSNSETETETH